MTGIEEKFPAVATDVAICRSACELLEHAWIGRRTTRPDAIEDCGEATGRDRDCSCALCAYLPTPVPRKHGDYRWRRSRGRPLTVKTWPYTSELDSVLTGGWVWTRKLNDSNINAALRFRYHDDILMFPEYKRVIANLDSTAATRKVRDALSVDEGVNGARALVVGLYARYKRSVDEHRLSEHTSGRAAVSQRSPLDLGSYTLLQLLDNLFWHAAPDNELWQAQHLAPLVLCRVLDDMADPRADALTGEISNFWLTQMSTHHKSMLAASAIAQIKYGCMPEAHGLVWESWLLPATIVWMGLAGRHSVWFDGITRTLPSSPDCPLCGLRPNACIDLLTSGVGLEIGCRVIADRLGRAATRLSNRCRGEFPQLAAMFHTELSAFEALHGPWRGNVDIAWQILRRTYLAAAAACLHGGAGAEAVQIESGVVGADLFYLLNQPPTWTEDTALLAFMFGCAHPHFVWNAQDYIPSRVIGDWVDG
ncbi:hypothetical protein [Nocardia thraciensis]